MESPPLLSDSPNQSSLVQDHDQSSFEETSANQTPSEFSFYQLPPFPHPIRHPLRAGYWLFELAFGVVSLWGLLALLASIPLLNCIALGYLLDAEGRVARTGKLRNAMPLLALAPKLGGIVAGCWFWWWMIRQVADAATDAQLIAPGSPTAHAWQIGLRIFATAVGIHLLLAIARGGRLGLFLWPTPLNAIWAWRQIRKGDYFDRSSVMIREFVSALRLRQHFWLGLRGFLLAFAWLFFPTALFATLRDTSKPGQALVTLIGGILLTIVLTWVPVLQAHFAARNHWRAMFELGTIRECYRRTPVVMTVAIVLLYALSLPLYLFKVAALPRDVYWLLTPIFILSIYPARILIGWTYSRAIRKETRSPLFLRWSLSLVQLGLTGAYVFILFFTPAIGAAGRVVLFQHHGVLLPWPY